MDTVLRLLFYEMLGLGLIATVVKSFSWGERLSKTRQASQRKLLRAPGETLQRETQVLNDWLMGLLAGIVATPAILLGQMPRTIDGRSIAIMAVAIVAWALPLIYLLSLRHNLELALRGERAVAEELNRLMLEGCHVFHDYPTGPGTSIDHIVIAPSGVYAIETKTQRKRIRQGAKNEAVVEGKHLLFPQRVETEALSHAARNAADLSRELGAATAEAVNVSAILALPGWSITRKGQADVQVLSPDEIRDAVVTQSKPALSPAQIQSLAQKVEQKCRNVEL